MWMGGPLWPPAVALGLDIRALHRRAATRAPTPPNSSPAPTRDLSLGHSLFLLLLSLMPIGEDKPLYLSPRQGSPTMDDVATCA